MDGQPVRQEMELALVDFLLSAKGRDTLQALASADLSEEQTIPLLTDLRRSFAPQEAGALLTQARLRRRAAAKFSRAGELFFTPEALEQATSETVAVHRARWIHEHAAPGPVLDLGCGIGGDSLALARFRSVIAYETSPDRLRLARANADALDLGDRIVFRQEDWPVVLHRGELPAAAAAFADPARRIEGRRVFSLRQMQPPLSEILDLQRLVPSTGAKVAPGVDDTEVPDNCTVEFISHEGTCKEAVLWFGVLQGDTGRSASVHDGATWHRLDASQRPPPLGALSPGLYLHEPDPAVIRAGAFAELCTMLDAHLFDSQIAYLIGPIPSSETEAAPLVQSFRVEEVMPGSLSQLNRRLKELGIARVELKKRGVPFEPESLRPRLDLAAHGESAVVIFTRLDEARITILAHRI